MAGLVAVLVIGVSATAAGVSTDPGHTPKAFAANETADIRGVDLAVARRSVSVRPVEGVLLTNAAVVEDQARAAAAAAIGRAAAQAAAVQEAARAAAEQASAQEAQQAVSASAPAPAPSSPAPAGTTGVNWDGVANCETGGNWSMQGSSYSGGLGFANTTWSGFGGGEFAGNAGQATREQQIIVAERVYARYGLSGWGCRDYG